MNPSESNQGPPQPTKPKACLGFLYFSQHRYDRGKPPVCTGFAKRLRPSDDVSQLTTDSIPGGEFKYGCLGYSAWDEEGLKQAAQRRRSQSDAVQLPYCEGLEIVSSAAVSGRPELLTEGPGMRRSAPQGSTSGSSDSPSGTPADVGQRPGRSFVPGMPSMGQPSDMDWDQFKGKFERMARKIVDKMAQNATFMGNTVRRSWEQILKEVTGGGGGGGGKERP